MTRRSRLSARQSSADHQLMAAELLRAVLVIVMALFCIVMVLLALAGDVHPNPGPGLSECVTSRSYTILCTDPFQVTRPHSNS